MPIALGPVVVVGGCNMDIVALAREKLVLGDSNPGEVQVSPGGVARNISENLARLGLDVHLVSALGADLFGQIVRQVTAEAGVKLQALHTFTGQRTGSYTTVHASDGEMAVAINDMGVLAMLTPEVLQAHDGLLRQASCIVADCNLTDSALAWVMQNANPAPRFIDAVSVAKCEKLRPWLGRIHTLKLNRPEAQALSGLPVTGIDDAKLAAFKLQTLGVQRVVISVGALGVVWCDAAAAGADRGKARHRGVHRPIAMVNSSGAGDALLAGLVYAGLRGLPCDQAVDWAMACAEITLASQSANAAELNTEMVAARLRLNNPMPRLAGDSLRADSVRSQAEN